MKKPLLILFFSFIIHLSLLITNCEAQWVQQTIPVSTSHPIKGIKFIDTLNGWACTGVLTIQDTSYIMRTTNGGTNWFIQYTGVKQGFDCLSMMNDSIGYAGGTDYLNSPSNTPLLMKTTNGGINWNRLTVTSTTMFPHDMFFTNKDSGWVCCLFSGPDVRTTTDGGLNWQVRTTGMNITTERLFFLNYNTGFCAASFNFYKTTNTGLNWVQIGNFMDAVLCTYFLNDNTGWVGTDNNKIYFTTNGGIDWNLQMLLPISGSVYDIYFLNQNTGWAGRGFNKIFKTTNSGTNWGYQIDTSGSYRISIIDSLHGWSCNNGISRTLNGGGPLLALQQTSSEVPSSYMLYQNYPNPFNPTTKIKFDVKPDGKSEKSKVRLIIFDILGRELKELVNQTLESGSYQFTFYGDNLPSGTYFYRLIIDSYIETRKMVLIK